MSIDVCNQAWVLKNSLFLKIAAISEIGNEFDYDLETSVVNFFLVAVQNQQRSQQKSSSDM